MSSYRTFYDMLGVSRLATPGEIKRAYRRGAMQWHPDRNPQPDAAARFREIATAYQVLSDPELRAEYDASLAEIEAEYRAACEQERQRRARAAAAAPTLAACEDQLRFTPERLITILEWIDTMLRRALGPHNARP